ncbi:DUF3147 family protein [Bradyrhizobium lablabi]|uniref:DUF3147 family protein n=1 Tax=Bradyrhizobium lablabi TaxID=722472 RepID=UPI001BAB2504|nr:DUF3147 family protein [Bradyrhizobium lablabi]MBR1125090.1 DUF3147 family protein [Bradyrhizobium lablabi]
MEYVLRFIVGGFVVVAFAALAEVLRPKSFAGLFGAAPSVALATLALAFGKHGADYVAVQARSMALGALAFALFSLLVCQLIMRLNWSALAAASASLLIWFVAAFGLEQALIG